MSGVNKQADAKLLAALKAILPYAESEAESLAECHRRDGGLELEQHVAACQESLANARAVVAEADRRAA